MSTWKSPAYKTSNNNPLIGNPNPLAGNSRFAPPSPHSSKGHPYDLHNYDEKIKCIRSYNSNMNLFVIKIPAPAVCKLHVLSNSIADSKFSHLSK